MPIGRTNRHQYSPVPKSLTTVTGDTSLSMVILPVGGLLKSILVKLALKS